MLVFEMTYYRGLIWASMLVKLPSLLLYKGKVKYLVSHSWQLAEVSPVVRHLMTYSDNTREPANGKRRRDT